MNSQMDEGRFTVLEKDWFGHNGSKPAFRVERAGDEWVFRVRVNEAPLGHPGASPGKFHEGLWRYDVAEWFIANRNTGRYMEWNLAPNGAWWMMLFSSPRQPVEKLPDLRDVRASAMPAAVGWEAELHVPQTLLVKHLGEGALTHNVCFILGYPRQYFSWVNFPVDDPDFHLPRYFRALKSEGR